MPLRQDIFENTFDNGINLDVDPHNQPNNTIRKAKNLQLIGDGKFGGLQNLKGTIQERLLKSASEGYPNNKIPYQHLNILGIYKSKYYVNVSGTIEVCYTIFSVRKNQTATQNFFEILVYRPSNNSLTTFYFKIVGEEYFNTSIDAFISGEGGVDSIYFTDHIDTPKKIRCILDGSVTDRHIELLRRYPRGGMVLDSITFNPPQDEISVNRHYAFIDMISLTESPTDFNFESDISLDEPLGTGDSCTIRIYYTYNVWIYEASGNGTATLNIDLRDVDGTSIAPFPVSILRNTAGVDTDSGYIDLVLSDSDAQYPEFDANASASSSGDPVSASLSIEISSINENSGGDDYFIGSPKNIYKSVTHDV